MRTRTAALLPLAAPTTTGEARGSVGGAESEAMRHERGERRIAGGRAVEGAPAPDLRGRRRGGRSRRGVG